MALTKDPDAVLDYAFDWSAWLADGETILTYDVDVEVGDAVVDSVTEALGTVSVWLSGGTLDTNVELRCRVTTSEGRIDDRTIVILIREVFAVDGCEPWPIVGYTAPDGTDPEILAVAEQAAQAFLNGASGRRFGTCTYTQRFQIRDTSSGVCYSGLSLRDGNCCAIRLPNTPIQAILGVKVDGVLLAPSSYAVLGGSRLGRLDGCWPQSADNVPGRVEVIYTAGIPLRPDSTYYGMAAAAMGEIVREYMNGLTGQACKLPSRFVTVARQGVTTQALDPSLFLKLSLTGLPMTDNFIRTVNPGGHRRRPRVVSIDGARRN
jgi:hypothetical protein